MTEFDPLLNRPPLPPPAGRPTPANSTPAPVRRPRRRHAARGSRIASAGLGVTTMLGLVASMGVANAVADDAASTSAATTPLPTAATSPTIPGSTAPTATLPPATEATTPTPAPVTTDLAPVTLTARPEVRVVTPAPAAAAAPTAAAPAPAPAATTRGSG